MFPIHGTNLCLNPLSSCLRLKKFCAGLLFGGGLLRTGLDPGGGLEKGLWGGLKGRWGGGGPSVRRVPKTKFSSVFKNPPPLEAWLGGRPLFPFPPPMKLSIVLKRPPLLEPWPWN